MNINEKRYDDSVKLALAFGEIDDRLVEEARVPARIFMTTKRLVTIAACLLVVMVVGIAAVGLTPMLAPKGDMANNAEADINKTYGVGEVVRYGDSSIVLVDKTGKYTFLLTLDNDIESLDIYIYGLDVTNPASGIHTVCATTADSAPSGYNRIDMPTLLVNGNEADSLPTTAGTYTITVDAGDLVRQGYVLQRFGITYFNAVFSK